MNKVYMTVLGVAATAIVAGASMVPANVLAWGDSNNGRTVYTTQQINAGALGNTITMNSITNGSIGDERNFVGAKLSTSNSTTWNADTINVQDGQIVTIRLYVHNNSPLGQNAIAQGVKVTFSLPTNVGKSQTVIGYLDATNATPTRYWDEVELKSDEDFYIEYVTGSAKYSNKDANGNRRTFNLPDAVISESGAMLGYDSMNGQIPGCFDFDGEVTIQVKVHTGSISAISKTVRAAGTHNEFTESVEAKVGDKVEFQIKYENLSTETVKNVMIRDILPPDMEYVDGTTILYNSNHKNGVTLDQNTVTTSGINIGGYESGATAYVRFTAKVVNKDLTCGSTQLVNWANVTVNSKVAKDDASVMLNLTENCTPRGKDEPETVIVNTGPSEVIFSALGAGSLITAAGYFIASRRKA